MENALPTILLISFVIFMNFLFRRKKKKEKKQTFTQEYKLPINPNAKRPELKKIMHSDDGCPICDGILVYSHTNSELRPNAFFSRYYCLNCQKDTAITIRIDHGKE